MHRRRAGLRQRHRPHRRRRRPLRLERAPGPPAPGLARRRHPPARPRRRRRPRPLRGALARGHRRAPRPPAPRPAPPGDSTVQVVRTVAEDMYDDVPARRLPDPRELRARAARRAAADLPREPVPVVAGDRRESWPTSCATRRATTSASSSCCRPRPTTARTPPAGSSASSPRPTTTPGASWRRRSARAPANAHDPLYVHAKVGIVDDRWLTVGSANLNAHSLLNDTEMNVVTDDAALARATRVRLWAEHLELEPGDDRRSGPRRRSSTSGSCTSRTSSSGRPRSSRPRRQAAPPAARRLPARRPAAGQGQQRAGRHAGQLSVLAAADDHAGRFLAATIRSRSGERADPLYVHAKVGIVDDRWLTVGSANLNAHSLLNDTELNVVTDDAAAGARDARAPAGPSTSSSSPQAIADADPAAVVDEHWRPIAAEQLERRERGAPPTHRLIALPGVSKRSRPPPRPAGGPHGRRLTPVSRALCARFAAAPAGRSVRAVAKVRRCFWKTPTPSPRRTDGGERGTQRAFGPRGESPAEGRRSARLTARARQLTP